MTDHEIEYEVRVAACVPKQFFAIADAFYTNTRANEYDKRLWRRFFATCQRVLVEMPGVVPTKFYAPPESGLSTSTTGTVTIGDQTYAATNITFTPTEEQP